MVISIKGLPSTYNKDLQIDKELMFNTFDKLQNILEVAIGVVETLKVIKFLILLHVNKVILFR